MPREIITFQCSECKNRNYTSTKNKKTTTERLEMKKFCPYCRKHHPHKETKEGNIKTATFADSRADGRAGGDAGPRRLAEGLGA